MGSTRAVSSWLLLLTSIPTALSGKHRTPKDLCQSNKLKKTFSIQFVSWQEKEMKRMCKFFIQVSYLKLIAFKIALVGGKVPFKSFHTVKVNLKKIKGSWETGKYKDLDAYCHVRIYKSWNLAIWYIVIKYQLWEWCQSQEKYSCTNGKENGILKYKLEQRALTQFPRLTASYDYNCQ